MNDARNKVFLFSLFPFLSVLFKKNFFCFLYFILFISFFFLPSLFPSQATQAILCRTYEEPWRWMPPPIEDKRSTSLAAVDLSSSLTVIDDRLLLHFPVRNGTTLGKAKMEL